MTNADDFHNSSLGHWEQEFVDKIDVSLVNTHGTESIHWVVRVVVRYCWEMPFSWCFCCRFG